MGAQENLKNRVLVVDLGEDRFGRLPAARQRVQTPPQPAGREVSEELAEGVRRDPVAGEKEDPAAPFQEGGEGLHDGAPDRGHI